MGIQKIPWDFIYGCSLRQNLISYSETMTLYREDTNPMEFRLITCCNFLSQVLSEINWESKKFLVCFIGWWIALPSGSIPRLGYTFTFKETSIFVSLQHYGDKQTLWNSRSFTSFLDVVLDKIWSYNTWTMTP